MERKKFINEKIKGKPAESPRFLYKYRPFDSYTYNMLTNHYVYLCPAEKLDDPSECTIDFSTKEFYDNQSNQIKLRGIECLLYNMRPYTSEENFDRVQRAIYNCVLTNGNINQNFLLDKSFNLQDDESVQLDNLLSKMTERLNEPNFRNLLNTAISEAYTARRNTGICSLSEIKDSPEMWNNYAHNSSGYCIEYDLQEYKYLDNLYPVVYQDERDNNIITSLMGSLIGQMIYAISNGQAQTDTTQFICLFLTKDTEWSYQKEWRLIGNAAQKLDATPINAIYLGSHVSNKNKRQMIQYCEKQNIKLEG